MEHMSKFMAGCCVKFDSKDNHVPCLAHIINLAAKDAINVLSSGGDNEFAGYLSEVESDSDLEEPVSVDVDDDCIDELEDLPVSELLN